MLTKVEQIIENEKIEAVNKAVDNTRKEEMLVCDTELVVD